MRVTATLCCFPPRTIVKTATSLGLSEKDDEADDVVRALHWPPVDRDDHVAASGHRAAEHVDILRAPAQARPLCRAATVDRHDQRTVAGLVAQRFRE